MSACNSDDDPREKNDDDAEKKTETVETTRVTSHASKSTTSKSLGGAASSRVLRCRSHKCVQPVVVPQTSASSSSDDDDAVSSPRAWLQDEARKLCKVLQCNDARHAELNACKDAIAQHARSRRWDRFKKATNDYELVSTSSRCSTSANGASGASDASGSHSNDVPNVSACRPTSRSFYKLWEILQEFWPDVRPTRTRRTATSLQLEHHRPMRALFLAEGPGGFVEAFSAFRRRYYPHQWRDDVLHGMTLMKASQRGGGDSSVGGGYAPAWDCSSGNRLRVHLGADGTGDLCKPANVLHMVDGVGRESCDLVTADGGFDFSSNFNTQEECSSVLLASEAFAALLALRKNGAFVLKLYDVSTAFSFRLVAMLRLLFHAVHVMKPLTSRPANSEKYLVCVRYRAGEAPGEPGPAFFSAFRNDILGRELSFSWVLRNTRVFADATTETPKKDKDANRGLLRRLERLRKGCGGDVVGGATVVWCGIDSLLLVSGDLVRSMAYFNVKYVARQMAHIRKTLDLIAESSSTSSESPQGPEKLRRQYNKCVRWCVRYDVPVSPDAVRKMCELAAKLNTKDCK